MERPTCETCVFFDDELDGRCRRNPPTPTVFLWPAAEEPTASTIWPSVWSGDWCGEHPDFPRYFAALDAGRHTPEDAP
jgi:hypothetical protein